jgi:sec-independent protein translocase protein TatB
MFGIGFWEFVLIVVLVILFLGPERIGPIMRTVGRVMREIQKGASEMRQALRIDDELEKIDDIKKTIVRDIAEDEEELERSSTKRLPGEEKKPAVGREPGEPAAKRWNELHDEDDVVVTVEPGDGGKSGGESGSEGGGGHG